MGKPTGFLEVQRQTVPERAPLDRLRDWREIHVPRDDQALVRQASRCMDCGTPFCHTGMLLSGMASGCPIHNLIPEFNDLVYRGRWREALARLRKTNNFPEFTGRVCPAPCEGSCVLGVIGPPVTIKDVECAIIDRGWEEGWLTPRPPAHRTGRQVAVVGSGPAGLACADQLNQAGHHVVVFERADRVGGLLTYGIPNMKLDKVAVVERRVGLMREEGVVFLTGVAIGADPEWTPDRLREKFDAVVLCCGATAPRDLAIQGRDAAGIHFAVDFLTANTRHQLDHRFEGSLPDLNARGRQVVVIGGGDTGTDCVGTSLRQGCRNVVQLEILPQPPATRARTNPWPEWPRIQRTDYGQEEAAAVQGDDPRHYQVTARRFVKDAAGHLAAVEIVDVEWHPDNQGRMGPVPKDDTARTIPCDLALLAMGFLGPEPDLVRQFAVETDARTNVKAADGDYRTNLEGVFAAGDMRRGQSLVVWAIREGRAAARECDRFLMGSTSLP